MTEHRSEILLWLFVIFSGIAVGGGLYEMRITVPQWFSRSPESGIRVNGEAMRSADAGRRFWVYVTTVPLTLLTLASPGGGLASPGPMAGVVTHRSCDLSRRENRESASSDSLTPVSGRPAGG